MITDLYKQKMSLELNWHLEHNLHGKYTLDMVRIDGKIRETINRIKLEEAKIASKENAIADSAPQVSVATQIKSYIVEIRTFTTQSLALYTNLIYKILTIQLIRT